MHDDAVEVEARTSNFENGRLSEFDKPRPIPEEADPEGVQAPGEDSQPDSKDPGGFVDLADDQRMRTTRSETELPSLDRGLASEMEQTDSTDGQKIVARPVGPFGAEVAVLEVKVGDEREVGSEASR